MQNFAPATYIHNLFTTQGNVREIDHVGVTESTLQLRALRTCYGFTVEGCHVDSVTATSYFVFS